MVQSAHGARTLLYQFIYDRSEFRYKTIKRKKKRIEVKI